MQADPSSEGPAFFVALRAGGTGHMAEGTAVVGAPHTALASEGLLSQFTRDGITIPAKETMAITRARKVATRNPAGYFQALADGVRAGLKESLREELRAEIEAEPAERDKERQIKAAQERPQADPPPTGGA